MNPTELIVYALTLGLAAGVKSTAEQSVKDMYRNLTERLDNGYDIDVAPLERYPDSSSQKAAVAEQIEASHAYEDAAVVASARALIDAIGQQPSPVTAPASVYAPTTSVSGSGNRVDNRQNIDNRQTSIDNSRTIINRISRNPILAVVAVIVLLGLLFLVLRGLFSGGSLPATPPYLGVFLVDGNEYVETLTAKGEPDPQSNFPRTNNSEPEVAFWLSGIDYNLLMFRPLGKGRDSIDDPANIPFRLYITEDDVVFAQFDSPLSNDVYCFVQGDWMGIPGQLNHYCFEVR